MARTQYESPNDVVTMSHGEAGQATALRQAYDDVWQHNGWSLDGVERYALDAVDETPVPPAASPAASSPFSPSKSEED